MRLLIIVEREIPDYHNNSDKAGVWLEPSACFAGIGKHESRKHESRKNNSRRAEEISVFI